MNRRGFLAGALVSPFALAACGDAKAPVHHDPVPSWTDLFQTMPDIYVVLRPSWLKRDTLYGNFWKALLRAAEARGLARGAKMIEAVEGSDEIVVGVNSSDAVVVLHGVPASLDPTAIEDADSHPLFKAPADMRPRVLEYQVTDQHFASSSALYVLPDRTWVAAVGPARDRARTAFGAPSSTPEPNSSPTALVSIRLTGPFLRLFERSTVVGPLTKKLETVTIELQPGNAGVVIALAYSEADATAYGEMQAKQIAAHYGNDKDRKWLKDAKIAYDGNVVYVHVAVPARLLEELPNVRGADLGL